MTILSIGEVSGKPKTPLNELFSKASLGWIDIVKSQHYPLLQDMLIKANSLAGSKGTTFNCFGFQFPQSLDDFGLLKMLNFLYGDKYSEYASQWSNSDADVTEQQIYIQHSYQGACPTKSDNNLYFMVSEATGLERVVYVGIAERGLLMRFFNGASIRAQNNNYIGDCRSYESLSKPQYTWRIKSAELKRRGVCKIYWTTREAGELKNCEKYLIGSKLDMIREACTISVNRDPINR
jgi:hypothetical protein